MLRMVPANKVRFQPHIGIVYLAETIRTQCYRGENL